MPSFVALCTRKWQRHRPRCVARRPYVHGRIEWSHSFEPMTCKYRCLFTFLAASSSIRSSAAVELHFLLIGTQDVAGTGVSCIVLQTVRSCNHTPPLPSTAQASLPTIPDFILLNITRCYRYTPVHQHQISLPHARHVNSCRHSAATDCTVHHKSPSWIITFVNCLPNCTDARN